MLEGVREEKRLTAPGVGKPKRPARSLFQLQGGRVEEAEEELDRGLNHAGRDLVNEAKGDFVHDYHLTITGSPGISDGMT
jgi:hypothetical protein